MTPCPAKSRSLRQQPPDSRETLHAVLRQSTGTTDWLQGCVNTYDSLACIGLWGDGASSVWSHSHTEALHFWDWRAALS